MRTIASLFAGLTALTLAGCANKQPSLPPPPATANGGALWRIIDTRCVPGQLERQDPRPCTKVSLKRGVAHGFVLLKDIRGVAQYLLMPTARITGTEDPAILAPDATNYFQKAWDARGAVDARLGRRLARTQLSIAVNSIYGRTQGQLHFHIDCVDRPVAATLSRIVIPPDAAWPAHTVMLNGQTYWIRWLAADQLQSTNPFRLLVTSFPNARREMGAWTIALIGAVNPSGKPGFYLLADRANPALGNRGSSESLQDHTCRDEKARSVVKIRDGSAL